MSRAPNCVKNNKYDQEIGHGSIFEVGYTYKGWTVGKDKWFARRSRARDRGLVRSTSNDVIFEGSMIFARSKQAIDRLDRGLVVS